MCQTRLCMDDVYLIRVCLLGSFKLFGGLSVCKGNEFENQNRSNTHIGIFCLCLYRTLFWFFWTFINNQNQSFWRSLIIKNAVSFRQKVDPIFLSPRSVCKHREQIAGSPNCLYQEAKLEIIYSSSMKTKLIRTHSNLMQIIYWRFYAWGDVHSPIHGDHLKTP